MKLVKASIINSGQFDIERTKTILVGPNEAGKTVLLRAWQQLNPPDDDPSEKLRSSVTALEEAV
jgi:ABC-type cobalamin/Fe3+-siderophores transport system ATPase subunit